MARGLLGRPAEVSVLLLSFAAAQSVQVFVNDPRGRAGPADQCVDAHCSALVDLLDRAERSVDFAVYGFRDQTAVVDALIRARDRGVAVRGVVDMDADGMNYYASTETVMAQIPGIRTDFASDQRQRDGEVWAGFDRCKRPAGFDGPLQCLGYDLGESCLLAEHASREPLDEMTRIMHHKFFVVDARWVWTGSSNISDSCNGGFNANLVTLVDSPVVAGWYTAELEEMAVHDRFHHEKTNQGPHRAVLPEGIPVEAWFSPTDRPISRAVRPLIQRATTSIDVAVFFLTHKEITRDLIAAHQRGVRVRVLLDATAATNEYTKHELLRVAGIPVKVEDWGGKMHMKSAVIDGKHLITGSMNWTSAGEGGNDENTLIFHDRALSAHVSSAFETLWTSVPERWLAGRPDPESRDSGSACTDGVDDDFDGLADLTDPGCSAAPPPMAALPPHRVVPKSAGEGVLLKGATVEGEKQWFWPAHPGYRALRPDGAGTVWLCSSTDAREQGYATAPKP